MSHEKVIITHPQNNYDPSGVITEGLKNLSGLEVMVLVNDRAEFVSNPSYDAVKHLLMDESRNVIFSYDGQLKSDDAEEMVESYESISLYGGCLNSCLYRTYKSVVKAFADSLKIELNIRFFLDGVYDDIIPWGGVLNLGEIVEDFSQYKIENDEAILFLMENFYNYPNSDRMLFNVKVYHSGKALYESSGGYEKSVKIDIFDSLPT
jgi:hypothetical protein